MTRTGKVLVIGDDTRSFLAIVRSLGRRKIEVHAAPFDFTSVALKSRYIDQVHWVPYYLGNGRAWLERIDALLRAESFDLVIACDERAIIPLAKHQGQLPPVRLSIPDARALAALFDKQATRELAQSLGIPVAPGGPIDAGAVPSADAPIFIKPRRSFSAADLYLRSKVEAVRSPEEMAFVVGQASTGDLIYERFAPGRGVGLSLLASQGRVLQFFQHHRVREDGGGSYYRVSAPVSPDLAKACGAIVEALSYTGLAMFEFRVDEARKTWVLLEVNARPWGSMPLPVALGVDFPYRWYRLLTEGVETPAVSYQTGVYGRNLMPDARQFLSGGSVLRRLPRYAAECGRVLLGREVHDVLLPDDPKPGFAEIAAPFVNRARRAFSRLPSVAEGAQHFDRERAIQALKGAKRIVFVCMGNICRSPYAALRLQSMLRRTPSQIEIVSAGMLPREGRPSPDNAVAAGRELGVDLTAHRSRHFDRDLADTASLVVIFDRKNSMAIAERYPNPVAPIIALSRFGQNVDPEIDDPDGGDLETFRRTYAAIDRSLRELAALIEGQTHDAG